MSTVETTLGGATSILVEAIAGNLRAEVRREIAKHVDPIIEAAEQQIVDGLLLSIENYIHQGRDVPFGEARVFLKIEEKTVREFVQEKRVVVKKALDGFREEAK